MSAASSGSAAKSESCAASTARSRRRSASLGSGPPRALGRLAKAGSGPSAERQQADRDEHRTLRPEDRVAEIERRALCAEKHAVRRQRACLRPPLRRRPAAAAIRAHTATLVEREVCSRWRFPLRARRMRAAACGIGHDALEAGSVPRPRPGARAGRSPRATDRLLSRDPCAAGG
jgi:hypothetical protein